MPLDQCHPRAEAARDECCDEARAARADDDHVITLGGRRILPVGGVDVCEERAVELVVRK